MYGNAQKEEKKNYCSSSRNNKVVIRSFQTAAVNLSTWKKREDGRLLVVHIIQSWGNIADVAEVPAADEREARERVSESILSFWYTVWRNGGGDMGENGV